MKTKLSALVLGVLLTQAAFAQFDIGIKGGANISKIEGRSFTDEFRYGYHLGGFAEIGLSKKISIQPEVLFNQYQTRVDSSFKALYQGLINPNSNDNIKLNYLSIPILLNYKLGSALSLQAGPQFGVLIDNNKNMLENGQAAFRQGDFSMVGGAQLSISKIRITGRYAIGLNNINDIDDQDKWNSQAVQLGIGLAL
jgi:hypothetical protein